MATDKWENTGLSATDRRIQRSRNLRYRKACVECLNMDAIDTELSEINDWIWTVQSILEDSEESEKLLKAFDDNDEELHSISLQISALTSKLDDFQEKLAYYEDEDFNDIFVLFNKDNVYNDTLGYDSWEDDWFVLDPYDTTWGIQEAVKRLKRYTKDELIDKVKTAGWLAFTFIALREDYMSIQASLDIMLEDNFENISKVDRLMKCYDKAMQDDNWKEFDRLLKYLPEDVWVR